MATIFQAMYLLIEFSYTQKKNKYFVLESSAFGVKTSQCMESIEPENQIQEFSRPKILLFGTFRSTIKYE